MPSRKSHFTSLSPWHLISKVALIIRLHRAVRRARQVYDLQSTAQLAWRRQMYGLCGPSLCQSLCLACSLHPLDTAVWVNQQIESLPHSSSGLWGPTHPTGLRPCSPDSAEMVLLPEMPFFFPFNFLIWNYRLTRSCQNSTEKSQIQKNTEKSSFPGWWPTLKLE